MGNHSVGYAIGMAAQEAVANRKQGETALDILDRICDSYRNNDAEFEASDSEGFTIPDLDDFRHPNPKAALGMLMLEAFSPGGISDIDKYAPMLIGGPKEDEACDAWYELVRNPFCQRYNFY